MLNWDGGIFQNDRIDLRVSSQNKVDWTLPNLNPDNNVGSDDAFDGATFTLFIDDEAGIELTLNQTISGGEFDGYSLKYESDQLTFGKLATVWTIFRRNW